MSDEVKNYLAKSIEALRDTNCAAMVGFFVGDKETIPYQDRVLMELVGFPPIDPDNYPRLTIVLIVNGQQAEVDASIFLKHLNRWPVDQ